MDWFLYQVSIADLCHVQYCYVLSVRLSVCLCLLHAGIVANNKPAIEHVQALADILRSALYAFAVYVAISLYTCML